MKVTISIIFILIACSTYYFFSQRSEISTSQINNFQEKKEETSNQNDDSPEKIEETTTINDEVAVNISNELKEELREENIDPEYAEQVSKEDFQEFITAAIEELDSGEDMAIALALEMKKIQIAQPLHRDIIQTFYEECLQKNNLSVEVKNLCRESLDELK